MPSTVLETGVRDRAALAPVGEREAPATVALRRRLAEGTLLPDEQARLEIVRTVRVQRAAGKTFADIAPAVGFTPKGLQAYARGAQFRELHDYLVRLEAGAETEGIERLVELTRGQLLALTPEIKVFIDKALERYPETHPNPELCGQYKDGGAAMWAVQFLAKMAGLSEPVGVTKPQINVHIETIQAVVAATRGEHAIAAGVGRAVEAALQITAEPALELENGA